MPGRATAAPALGLAALALAAGNAGGTCTFSWSGCADVTACFNAPSSAWVVEDNQVLRFTGEATGRRPRGATLGPFDEAVCASRTLPTAGAHNVSVWLRFPAAGAANPAGLITRVRGEAGSIGPGADNWRGYEISVWPGPSGSVRIGGHCGNYSDLANNASVRVVGGPDTPFVALTASLEQSADSVTVTVAVDGQRVLSYVDTDFAACTGAGASPGHYGVRSFGGAAEWAWLVTDAPLAPAPPLPPPPPPPPPVTVVVDVSAPSPGSVSPLMRGAGIEDVNHELYGGISSQMLFGENFEEPAGPDGVSGSGNMGGQGTTWVAAALSGMRGTGAFNVTTAGALAGAHSQLITLVDGQAATVANMGLSTQGLVFEQGREYEGYLVVRGAARVRVSLGLAPASPGPGPLTLDEIGHAEIVVNSTAGGGLSVSEAAARAARAAGWQRVNFSIVAAESSSCAQSAAPRTPCETNPEGVCVECTGAFAVSVVTEGASIEVDFGWLEPGAWGKYRGTVSRNDIGAGLADPAAAASRAPVGGVARKARVGPAPVNAWGGLGFTVLRLGGSMSNAAGYRWKNFRGPRWKRPPYDGTWYKYASGSWRVFEFLDYCEAANLTKCVVTLNNEETPADMADLVEYAHGNATTAWGAKRAADGQHPEPYRPFVTEIGNEQGLTTSFVDQVKAITEAMEARATELRLPFKLEYAIGHNYALGDLDSPLTKAMLDAVAPVADRTVWDCHVGGDHTADALASWELVTSMLARFRELGSPVRASVFEENGGHHDLSRALGHARQNNRFSRLGDQFVIDTTANCLQAQSRNNNRWDQGVLFYLPNMTWPSPLGYSIKMISASSQPVLVAVEDDPAWNNTLDVLAVRSQDAKTIVIRVVNTVTGVVPATFAVRGVPCGDAAAVDAQELFDASGDLAAVNPPCDPTRVSPRRATAGPLRGEQLTASLKGYSFTVITLQC